MKSSISVRVALSLAVLCGTGVLGAVVAADPASAATPKLVVTPFTNLKNGEKVKVSGSGFTPGDTVYVVECQVTTKGESGCDIATATAATISSSGKLPTTTFKVITGKVGNGTCGTTKANLAKCEVSAGNAAGGDSAVKHVVFKLK